ncbi:MAG: hypothetical protein ACXV6M_13855 [Ilumatobacteraceae bacterium]
MRRTWWIGLLVVCGCGNSSTSLPPAVQSVVDSARQTQWMTTGIDPWEVFVCHVPKNSTSPVYSGLPLRLALKPDQIAKVLDSKVTGYFETLSNGLYRPQFSAGGEVTIGTNDEPQACVDRALMAAGAGARGVLVVADAEHNADQPGGFGNQGGACAVPPCRATATRRSAYVGAADFSPDWGDQPPMDLIEHEIGHALGWPHSGYDESAPEPHRSALDVMSDSAAPRAVHPARRNAPDTLAVNRLAAAWLPASAVVAIPPAGATVTLAPSNGSSGTRLAVIELDDHRFITVELLIAAGFDEHLPASGVALHLIEVNDATRVQTPLVGSPPFDKLLTVGMAFTTHGWRISVGSGWRTTMQRVADTPTVSD